MNFDILEQMVKILKKMHPIDIAGVAWRFGIASPPTTDHRNDVLLHGDLTPHNVLVSFGKIVAVMDFELAFVGPLEWDLARTAFFSWNYMKNISFEQVAQFVLEKYANDSINSDLFYKYVVENAQKHLDSVEKHRNDYDHQEDWDKDNNFATKQLKLITTI